MKNIDTTISPDTISHLFPFHIILDSKLVVKKVGPALEKACPKMEVDRFIGQDFRIVTPNVKLEFSEICDQLKTVFFLEHHTAKFTLKGEMRHVQLDSDSSLQFLCSPVIKDLEGISQLGLSLNDFAIHDSTVDLLVLLQTKNTTIKDITRMADRLTEEVKIRRETEQALKEANEILEVRVDARTMELKKTNEKLQKWINQLEQRNSQISTLNSLSEMLQGCNSVEDTQVVICSAMRELFPASSGKLTYYNKNTGTFETRLNWGDDEACFGQELRLQDCTALKSRNMLICDKRYRGPMCSKMKKTSDHGTACYPLVNDDKIMGLIHLQYALDNFQDDTSQGAGENSFMQRALIRTAADQISQAVANLRLREELVDQATLDALTGLYNRHHIDYSLTREMSRAKRNNSTIILIMLDIDHFKKFNDTHGHQAGDVVLQYVGTLIRENVRAEDIGGRFGGEEFMVVMPDVSLQDGVKKAEELMQKLRDEVYLEFEGHDLGKVTASFGVAVFPQHAVEGDRLIAAADQALYRAKELGRNRVEIAKPNITKLILP